MTIDNIKTLQDFAEWLSAADDLPLEWEDVAAAHGWSLCDNDRDYCTDGESVVTTLDDGRIVCRETSGSPRKGGAE